VIKNKNWQNIQKILFTFPGIGTKIQKVCRGFGEIPWVLISKRGKKWQSK